MGEAKRRGTYEQRKLSATEQIEMTRKIASLINITIIGVTVIVILVAGLSIAHS